jgi:hypothetical protein
MEPRDWTRLQQRESIDAGMPVSWVEHRGRRVLYVDYRNLGSPECIGTLHAQEAAIAASPAPVLTLVDLRGAQFSNEFMWAARVAGPSNNTWTMKRAAVGADGFNRVLLARFNEAVAPVTMKAFPTIEEALDYLTEP